MDSISNNSWQSALKTQIVPSNQSSVTLGTALGGSATATAAASYASGIFGSTGYTSIASINTYADSLTIAGETAYETLGIEPYNLSAPLSSQFVPYKTEDTGWTFIVAPEDISWDVNAKVDRIEIYGTNAPPVVSGTKGMRDLTLGNALVEGFSRLRTVEDKIIELENLQNFTLNSAKGFINTPVYQIWANNKKYGYGNGVDGGYFIIESISVKETMRDLDGNSTRAFVDVKLIQVPSYQVDSGRDQASSAQAGAKSILPSVSNQAGQNLKGTTAAAKAAAGASSASTSGSGGTSSNTSSKAASVPALAPGERFQYAPPPKIKP